MISKGTIVTCEDKGHPIASLGRHIKHGDKIEAEDLEKWRMDEPHEGADLADMDCPDCGGKWARKHKDGGVAVHTQHDGWQPGEDEGLK